jgi:hypothetical protein
MRRFTRGTINSNVAVLFARRIRDPVSINPKESEHYAFRTALWNKSNTCSESMDMCRIRENARVRVCQVSHEVKVRVLFVVIMHYR